MSLEKTTMKVYPTLPVTVGDKGSKTAKTMSNIELQQLIVENQLQATIQDNILKTQTLTAEGIQQEQQIEQLKQENKSLKDTLTKIGGLDARKLSVAEALSVKNINQQKALLSQLIYKRRQMEEQIKKLSEVYNPDEKIKIDDVPGTDRIKQLELDVERMKLKLNESVNIKDNFEQILQVLKKEEIHYDIKEGGQEAMLADAEEEFKNAIQVRVSAQKASEVMNENFKFRENQMKEDSEKRKQILVQRKEQVRAEKEKTDYICNQMAQHDYEGVKHSYEAEEEIKWTGAAEFYREKISAELKIKNPYDFVKMCQKQFEEIQKDAVNNDLKSKIQEQVDDMIQLRNRIQDSEYECESNRSIQKKLLLDTQMEIERRKQVRDQALMKHSEQKQKTVYLKTAFSSILDKLGANQLVPEDFQQLMVGDDVLIDSLASMDRKIFDSFVILSKTRWLNELMKQLAVELEKAQVLAKTFQKSTSNVVVAEILPVIQPGEFTLDEDVVDVVVNQEANTVKIEMPSSRPGSRGPLGGTRNQKQPEIGMPQQVLKVADRQAMKNKSLALVNQQAQKAASQEGGAE